MAYTFNIKKTSGDVSFKDFKLEWDPNARVIKATVWLRGDDYDRDDAYVPYMVLKEPFGTERKRVYLNDISST